jgi:hypothetical protein
VKVSGATLIQKLSASNTIGRCRVVHMCHDASRRLEKREEDHMGLIMPILTLNRDGKLCRYEPRMAILGPSFTRLCAADIRGDDEPSEECPSFRLSKDRWYTGSHERVVLVPDAEHGGEDDDWHVYRWSVGNRCTYSADPSFRAAVTSLLGKEWPEKTVVSLCDTVEKVM